MPFWSELFGWSPQSQTATTGSVTTWTLPTATTLTSAPVWSSVFIDQGTGTVYTSLTQTAGQLWASNSNLWQQQQAYSAMAQQAAYDRYQFGLSRPLGLAQLFQPSRPAIISHQDELRREQAAYRRAVAEHDQQEQARLLREIERLELSAAEQQRAVEAQRARHQEEQRQRRVAKERARELLLEHLTPSQRETFDANGWFIVEGGKSKTKYRIRAREDMVANVDVMKGEQTSHRLCAHVRVGTVPLGDQLLAQKVMIELAEDDFLRTANRHAA